MSSNSEIRKSYNKAITNAYESHFKGKFQEFHDQDMCFGPELAKEAFEARHDIKSAHQGETSAIGNFFIGVHNLYKYGSWSNPSFEYLLQHKNPEELAYSAFKTDGSDLGLENNGFGEVLKEWKAVHADNPELYPEYMTNDGMCDIPVEFM